MENLIPFKRRSSKEVPIIKYTFYNTATKKNETVDFYNYQLHLKKFGFEWTDAELEFLHTVKMSTDKKKLIRKMKMGKKRRKLLFLDESRIWNLSVSAIDRKKLISYMFGYFWTDRTIETIYPI